MSLMTFEWNPAISIGVGTLDAQHRELFSQINALMMALASGRGKEEVGRALRFLEDYVLQHFSLEERYMIQHEYPDMIAHRSAHLRFTDDFVALKATYEDEGPSMKLALEVQRRIGEWLVTHIKKADMALGDFLRGRI